MLFRSLAVASPGPDFAVMLRQALCQTRRNALLSAIGIGGGILVHVCYSLLGIGLLIQQSIVLFNVLKVLGALYLAWIAVQCLRARAGGIHVEQDPTGGQSGIAALRLGFLTNALNPKATLFFVSLFSVVISPGNPLCSRPAMAFTWPWPRHSGSPWLPFSLPCPVSAAGLTGSGTGSTG